MNKIDNTLAQNGLEVSDLTPKAKRFIEKIKSIEEKVEMAKELHEDENTDESREDYESLVEFMNDSFEDFEDEIKIISEAKSKNEESKKVVEEADKKAKSDAQKLAQEEADKKAKEEAENKKPEPKKKSGLGMFILGAVVLVATAGVVNVMSKK
jgi:glutamyl/glutaminyl-tRNA synthetase